MVDKYHINKDSSITMTPKHACKQLNKGNVYFNQYGDIKVSNGKPKFKIGDRVRLSKIKRYDTGQRKYL